MSRATALPPKLDRRFETLVLGFGGARPRGEVLELDPRLTGGCSSCGCAFGRRSCACG